MKREPLPVGIVGVKPLAAGKVPLPIGIADILAAKKAELLSKITAGTVGRSRSPARKAQASTAGTVGPSRSPARKAQGSSKKICPFFAKGLCRFGDACVLAHEASAAPDRHKSADATWTDFDENLADPAERRPAVVIDLPLCPFFAKGFCGFGDHCKKLHPGSETMGSAAAAAAATKEPETADESGWGNASWSSWGDDKSGSWGDGSWGEGEEGQTDKAQEWDADDICPFFKKGYCGFGDACKQSHDVPKEKMELEVCKFFAKGYCGFGNECVSAHVLPEKTDAEQLEEAQDAWKSKGKKSGGKEDSWEADEEGRLPDGTFDKSWNTNPNKWYCTGCNYGNFLESVVCFRCNGAKPGIDIGLETLLFEKYCNVFKKWQKESADNQTAWQNYCDSNGQARKYDPRRKTLTYVRNFFRQQGTPSPDPEGDAALDEQGGPQITRFMALPKANGPTPEEAAAAAAANDPMYQLQLQMYLYQQMQMQQQATMETASAQPAIAGAEPPTLYAALAAQYGEAGLSMASQYGM